LKNRDQIVPQLLAGFGIVLVAVTGDGEQNDKGEDDGRAHKEDFLYAEYLPKKIPYLKNWASQRRRYIGCRASLISTK
jgi:hypothetical protein